MAPRYSYTPRRSGKRPSPRRATGGVSNDGTRAMSPVLPILAVLTVLVAAIWFASQNDGSLPDVGQGQALALVATPAPEDSASRMAIVPQRTPREEETPPPIDAVAAAVMEAPCGDLLLGLNHRGQLPPASLTKIATALVAAQSGDLAEVIDIEIDGGALSLQTDSTVMGVKPGQQLTLEALLYGLMLRSGYDAAITIANEVGGSEQEFVAMMNALTASLGLDDTHFVNPHGLDHPNHYSSAYDMAALGVALLQEPTLAEIVATREYTPAGWTDGPLENINFLLGSYPGAIGIKTGFTDLAGQTLVGAAERDGRTIVVSIMNSENLYVDAEKLLDWAFDSTVPACGATNDDTRALG